MRLDVARDDRGAVDDRNGMSQPRRGWQQRRRDRGRGGVVRRLRQRMAMLMAARLVRRCRRMAGRHLGDHSVGFTAIERTDVACHRQLLEQQGQKRNQRDPTAAAKALRHGTELTLGTHRTGTRAISLLAGEPACERLARTEHIRVAYDATS